MAKYFLLVAVLLISVSCGADSSSPTSPSLRPFNQTVTGTVNALGVTQHSLSIPRTGTMTLVLSWGTNADLDLYLTNTTCNAYPPLNCETLATSTGFGPTERIARSVTSGENFKVWVDSFASFPQSYSIAITIE